MAGQGKELLEMSVEDLLHFAYEREQVRKRKESGQPAPWTDDDILRTYRFCNVRRPLDKVSSWLRKHVLTQKHIEYDLRSFLLFSAWARLTNWPPTAEAAMAASFYPRHRINWKGLGKFVDQRGKKQKVFTGAFMLPAPKTRGKKKGEFLSEVVVGRNLAGLVPELRAALAKPSRDRSCQEVWLILRKCRYLGSFLSGQIVADWSYTSLLSEARDLYTWAPMGPGSVRGYNRILGLVPITKRPKEEEWLARLGEWRAAIVSALGPEYADLTAQDCQSCLCELDKLLRVRNGEGRPRAKYRSHEGLY